MEKKEPLRAKSAGLTLSTNVPTAGEIFPDGTMVELATDHPAADTVRLLVWNGKEAILANSFEFGKRIYIPETIHPSMLRGMRLPARPEVYSSTRQLFDEVYQLISRYVDLPAKSISLIVNFILATWFIGRVDIAPFLWITVPPSAASRALLRLLGLLCRRSLVVTEMSMTGLRSLPMMLKPTLLTEVVGLTPGLLKGLRASAKRGACTPRNGQAMDLFCAKAVFSQQPLLDPALVGFPLQIALPPSRQPLSVLDPATSEGIATKFQGKLLMYRLMNAPQFKDTRINAAGLTSPTQELAQTLANCLIGDAELQAQIVPLLQEHDLDVQAYRSTGLESLILEASLYACHTKDKLTVSAGELAKITNTISEGRGLAYGVTAETVGWRLKSLGLYTVPIGTGANGLRLSDAIRRRIHELASAFGVPSLLAAPLGLCTFCPTKEARAGRA